MAHHIQAYDKKMEGEEVSDRRFSFMYFLFMIYLGVAKFSKFNVWCLLIVFLLPRPHCAYGPLGEDYRHKEVFRRTTDTKS